MTAALGFFGKLPALGDFVQRRLPAGFVGPWDQWLQTLMLGSRAALGADWLRCYRAAPAWRFLLAPGCIDEQAWTGLLLPSIDRAGRHFPLTLAQAHAGAIDVAATLHRAGSWFDALEQLGQDALDPQLDLSTWDARLRALAAPPLAPAALLDDATLPLRPATRPFEQCCVHGGDDAWVAPALAGLRAPACLFAAPPTVLVCAGLPGVPAACTLFDIRRAARLPGDDPADQTCPLFG